MAVVAIGCLAAFVQTDESTWLIGAYLPLALVVAVGLLIALRPDLVGPMEMQEPEPSSDDLLRVIADSMPTSHEPSVSFPQRVVSEESGDASTVSSEIAPLDPFSVIEPPQVAVPGRVEAVTTEQQEAANVKIAEIFVNLGRRNKQLNRQMLTLISHLERDELDPDLLEGLYELDHLATRMRRNEETLLNLSSTRKIRQWSQPVKVEDVLRSALAEVERFARVEIDHVPDVEVLGAVVADATHLLAELLDNATLFSHTSTTVTLSAHTTLEGVEIEVLDSGHGIDEPKLLELNDLLENPPSLWDAPSRRLGLFIAALLAKDHEIGVTLSGQRGVGTVATVALPHAVLVEDEEDAPSLDAIDLVDPVLQIAVGSELAAEDEVALADATIPTEEEVADALPSFPTVTIDEDLGAEELPSLVEEPLAATFPLLISSGQDATAFEPEVFDPTAFYQQVFEPAEFESSDRDLLEDPVIAEVVPLPSRIPQATLGSVWKDAPLQSMPAANVTPMPLAEALNEDESYDEDTAQGVARRAASSIAAFAHGVSHGLQSVPESAQGGSEHALHEGDEQ